MRRIIPIATAALLSAVVVVAPARCQNVSKAGQLLYEQNCGVCHGGDGMGGEMGPNIVARVGRLTDEQLLTLLHDGRPQRGMPGFPNLSNDERTGIVSFLRATMRPRRRRAPVPRSLELIDGSKLSGLVLNESPGDLQLRTADQKIHLLRPDGERFREATSQADWTTYNGDVRGNRYSLLDRSISAT